MALVPKRSVPAKDRSALNQWIHGFAGFVTPAAMTSTAAETTAPIVESGRSAPVDCATMINQ